MNSSPTKNKLLLFLSVLSISIISRASYKAYAYYSDQKDKYKNGEFIVYSLDDSKVLGISDQSKYIQADFSHQISKGSPLVFGGAANPPLEHESAWNLIEKVGVTSLRRDFILEWTLNNGMTIDDYKNNINNIQAPSNWRQDHLTTTTNIYENARERGLKTIGIVTYTPFWLTSGGSQHDIPVDWDIYEDIVKKTYKINREFLDYIEIWNEPDYKNFLQASNNNERYGKYEQIFLHASKAIREVDTQMNDGKVIPIGGPVSYQSTDTSFLEKMLSNPEVMKYLDFVSLHHYGSDVPNLENYKTLLAKKHSSDLPIFITEWNYDPKADENGANKTGAAAIPYTAKMILGFLRQGVAGANYFSLTPVDSQHKQPGHGYLAFYTWNNQSVVPLPQVKTWQVLSKSLQLGDGESLIYETDTSPGLVSLGLENHQGNKVVAITNDSYATEEIIVSIRGLDKIDYIEISTFEGSSSSDGSEVVSSSVIEVSNGTATFNVIAHPNSVIGLKIKETQWVLNSFDKILKYFYRNSIG